MEIIKFRKNKSNAVKQLAEQSLITEQLLLAIIFQLFCKLNCKHVEPKLLKPNLAFSQDSSGQSTTFEPKLSTHSLSATSLWRPPTLSTSGCRQRRTFHATFDSFRPNVSISRPVLGSVPRRGPDWGCGESLTRDRDLSDAAGGSNLTWSCLDSSPDCSVRL